MMYSDLSSNSLVLFAPILDLLMTPCVQEMSSFRVVVYNNQILSLAGPRLIGRILVDQTALEAFEGNFDQLLAQQNTDFDNNIAVRTLKNQFLFMVDFLRFPLASKSKLDYIRIP